MAETECFKTVAVVLVEVEVVLALLAAQMGPLE
jgi:hypothetical protein